MAACRNLKSAPLRVTLPSLTNDSASRLLLGLYKQ
jgi:hypothetical protein